MNVIGTISIDRFTKQQAERARRPALADWITRVLPRHIRRVGGQVRPVVTERQIAEEYRKRDKKTVVKLVGLMQAGTRFQAFDPDGYAAGQLSEDIRRVIDWLDSVPEWDRHFRRMDRMSLSDAMALSASWHAKLLTLSADADDPDVVEEKSLAMDFPDGCRFFRLDGPVALLREGKLMGHCVGGEGYVDKVLSGNTGIYSLRDPANRPHVTIEVHRGVVLQIKGKGNAVPNATWAGKARDFVLANAWAVRHDGNAIGLVTLGGRTFGNPVDLVDYLLAAGFDLSKGLRHVLPDAVMRSLVARSGELSAGHKTALAERLAATAMPEPELEAIVIEGPGGTKIARYRHQVPPALADALTTGMLAGIEDTVARHLGEQLDRAFAAVRQNLGHLHVIDMGLHGEPGLLDRIAAFSGRTGSLRQLRADVSEARRNSHSAIVVAIRRETSVTGRRTSRDGRSWAAEWSRLPQVSPEGVEKLRTLNPGMSYL